MTNKEPTNDQNAQQKAGELQYAIYKLDIVITHLEDITDLIKGYKYSDKRYEELANRLEKVNKELYETISTMETLVDNLRQTYLNND